MIRSMNSVEYKGSCVCGQTTYEAFDLEDVSYCHCEQCRKMTGHYMAACQVKTDKIIIKGKGELCYNAVTICNIITENILKGNSKIQNITVDSEILDDGQMISTIELVLIKTN